MIVAIGFLFFVICLLAALLFESSWRISKLAAEVARIRKSHAAHASWIARVERATQPKTFPAHEVGFSEEEVLNRAWSKAWSRTQQDAQQ